MSFLFRISTTWLSTCLPLPPPPCLAQVFDASYFLEEVNFASFQPPVSSHVSCCHGCGNRRGTAGIIDCAIEKYSSN